MNFFKMITNQMDIIGNINWILEYIMIDALKYIFIFTSFNKPCIINLATAKRVYGCFRVNSKFFEYRFKHVIDVLLGNEIIK